MEQNPNQNPEENEFDEDNRLELEGESSNDIFDSADDEAAEGAENGGDIKDQKIQALEAQLSQTKDQMLRALAEAENTRKRAMKDRQDIGKYAVAEFAKDLLDFADNFRRALESIPDDLKGTDPRFDNVITGVEAMEKDILKTFDKHGIEKIEPLDEPFDPNFHEVMFEAPGTGKSAGIIIQIVEPGYVLKGRLLRPARVGVSKGEDGGNATDPGGRIDQQI